MFTIRKWEAQNKRLGESQLHKCDIIIHDG